MRGQRKWRVAAMLAATLAMGVVSGCGSNEEDGGGGDDGGATAGAPKNGPGFDGKTIKLGVLSPLTGPVAVIGKPLTAGNKVWVDYINSKGGIAGKYKIELVEEDTQYQPQVAVQQYNKIKGDVVAFQQVLGTPSTLAVLPQLVRDKILAAPASLDAFWVREENLLPIGGPYQIQNINAMQYLVDEEGMKDKPVCAIIQDDAYGEAGLAGVEFAAEKLGVEIATVQKYKAGDKDVAGQVQALSKAKCAAVFLTATPSDAGTVWGTAAKLGFAPRWVGQSPVWVNALAKSPLAPYLEKTAIIASEGTEWGDESVPGMKDMVARQKEFAPDQEPDYYFAFGYNQGRAMSEVLEKAVADGDLSREGLLKASKEVGTVSFDGLTGDYQYGEADTRKPPLTSTLFKVDPSKPFGLAKFKYQFSSPVAEEFTFEKADL